MDTVLKARVDNFEEFLKHAIEKYEEQLETEEDPFMEGYYKGRLQSYKKVALELEYLKTY